MREFLGDGGVFLEGGGVVFVEGVFFGVAIDGLGAVELFVRVVEIFEEPPDLPEEEDEWQGEEIGDHLDVEVCLQGEGDSGKERPEYHEEEHQPRLRSPDAKNNEEGEEAHDLKKGGRRKEEGGS